MRKITALLLAIIVLTSLLKNIGAEAAVPCSAKAFAVINAESGEVIFEGNSNQKLPMASTTKIMTALLLCEYGNENREIHITREMVAVEGSSMGLLEGDIVTLKDLLYGLLLASGNDAANTIAFVVGGSVENFVRIMNEKAKEIGLLNTNFVTPSGLDADEHYTTAYELALLAAYAMNNSRFKEAASTVSYTAFYGNPPYKRKITNHNKLLKTYEGLNGVKTGFTKKSGRCLVTSAERDGKSVIVVTLNDPNDWQDHKRLLDLGLDSLKTVEAQPKNKKLIMQVVGGNKDSLTVNLPSVSVNCLEGDKVKTKIIADPFLYAPVKVGQKVAELEISLNGKPYKTVPICSNCEISFEKSRPIVWFLRRFEAIFFSL